MRTRPAGFTKAAFVSSAMPTNAPAIPAGREPTSGGAKRYPAKAGSGVCASAEEARRTLSTAVGSWGPASIGFFDTIVLFRGLSIVPPGRAAYRRLEQEAGLEIEHDASFASRHGEGERVLGLDEGEPDPAPQGRVPTVGGLLGDEDPADVGQPVEAEADRQEPVVPRQEQPQLRVAVERPVAGVALAGQAAHGLAAADRGRLLDGIAPPYP